ncbi:MAG: YbhB/YbcL family Raf kinase inhibitor-like protein [Candidatus Limnocylindria bacterium]
MTARRMLRSQLAALLLTACTGTSTSTDLEAPSMTDSLTVTSTAFKEREAIPSDYGCDGSDVSPPLAWSGAPDGTAAFAIVVDDPDARGFVHWLAADIPGDTTSVDEGEAAGAQGRNDFGRSGYGGPCPPSGEHRYVFTVHALSETLGLSAGFSADELRAAMEGRILATGELSGTYRRGSGG